MQPQKTHFTLAQQCVSSKFMIKMALFNLLYENHKHLLLYLIILNNKYIEKDDWKHGDFKYFNQNLPFFLLNY